VSTVFEEMGTGGGTRVVGQFPITALIRWDEKAGLQRDAIRSQ
jgi:hypothetical protein